MENQTEQCSYCGAMFTVPNYHRPPSDACLNCCAWVRSRINGGSDWEEVAADEQLEIYERFMGAFHKALSGKRPTEGKA